MNTYHKIQSIFKRDPKQNYKKFIMGEYSLPEFDYLKDLTWRWEEKVDGTNMRVLWNKLDVGPKAGRGNITFNYSQDVEFRGKTDKAQLHGQLIEKMGTYFTKEKLKEIFNEPTSEVCLYGEGFGGKIQKGHKYNETMDFILFDVKVGKWWLQREDVVQIASFFGVQYTPVIAMGSLIEALSFTRHGFKSQWGDFIAEGLVAKPEIELKTRSGQRIITKIKHKDF